MVIKSIKYFIQVFSSGIRASFGNMIAKEEKEKLRENFNIYETGYLTICSILFICTMILIVPFISIYTKNVTDANYIRKIFAYLLVTSEYIWAIRLPYSTLAVTANRFNDTKKGALVEVIVNIIISIILIQKYGIEGVVIGTIVAMTIRTIEFIYYSNKHILNRNIMTSAKKVFFLIMETVICIILSKYLLFLENISYFNWIINSLIVTVTISIIIFLINYTIYKNDFKRIFKIIRNVLKKRTSISRNSRCLF